MKKIALLCIYGLSTYCIAMEKSLLDNPLLLEKVSLPSKKILDERFEKKGLHDLIMRTRLIEQLANKKDVSVLLVDSIVDVHLNPYIKFMVAKEKTITQNNIKSLIMELLLQEYPEVIKKLKNQHS